MTDMYQQSWRDLQLELRRKLEKKMVFSKASECPDCANKIYFLEGGFLCPVCGYSAETVYVDSEVMMEN